MLGRSHLIVPLVLALTSAACSTNHPVETPARTTEDVGSPLGAARRLAAWDGAIAASLAPKTGAWRAEGSGFATVLGGFEIGVDTTFEVRAGAHRALSLAPLGAQAASTALEDGHLVQRGAFRATDVLWTASRGRVESYFLLHDASAPTSFAWKLAFDPSWRPLLGDQALTFVDASNATRLRVSAPIAIDGDGHRATPVLSLDGDTLTLRLDTRGLHFPILLDPAVETPVWEHLCTAAPCSSLLPPGRNQAAAAFDANRAVTVLFGGFGIGGPGAPISDLWEWNGTAFTKSTVTGAPGGRWGARMVYDPTQKRILLFGGVTAGTMLPTDVNAYDGTKWTALTATGTPPPGGVNMGVAWDSTRNVLVVFGGGYGGTLHSDTYEWASSTGAWSTKSPTTVPDARETLMEFDPVQNQVVMFGGVNPAGVLGDTWLYAAGDWTKPTLATPPPQRSDYAMIYESRRKKIVVVGGNGTSGPRDDAWEWDGAAKTWTAVGTMETAVRFPTAAFDSARGRVVVNSGQAAPGYLSGTFELHVRGNACAEGCDTASCQDGVCCESTCGACERCDLAATAGVCTTIKDTEGPRCSGTSACDATGACVAKKAKGEACSAAIGCASGFCVDSVCCDTACTSSCQACDVSGALGTCTTVAAGAAHGARTCGAALCDGTSASCPTTCASDAACTTGSFCDAGHCAPKNALGAACTSKTSCASGFCVSGVCCNTACDGPCGVCNATSAGYCAPIVGVPKGGCGLPGDGTACAAKCDGMDTTACHFAPAATTPCSSNGCADGTETHASTCDGAGHCNDVPRSCGAYVCGTSGCKTSCTSTADCAMGSECAAGICAPPAVHCSADKSASIDEKGNSTPCAPYLCAGTTCSNTCGSSADCVQGTVCDLGARLCVASPPNDSSGGCAVSTPSSRSAPIGERSDAATHWLLLVCAIASACRISRRTSSRP